MPSKRRVQASVARIEAVLREVRKLGPVWVEDAKAWHAKNLPFRVCIRCGSLLALGRRTL